MSHFCPTTPTPRTALTSTAPLHKVVKVFATASVLPIHTAENTMPAKSDTKPEAGASPLKLLMGVAGIYGAFMYAGILQ